MHPVTLSVAHGSMPVTTTGSIIKNIMRDQSPVTRRAHLSSMHCKVCEQILLIRVYWTVQGGSCCTAGS